MSTALEWVTIIFLATFIIIGIVLCVYLAKLLNETAKTMESVRNLTDLTKTELEPALKSINNVLKTVDNVTGDANKHLNLVKKVLTAVLGASFLAYTKFTNNGGFLSGLVKGFNLFSKRR